MNLRFLFSVCAMFAVVCGQLPAQIRANEAVQINITGVPLEDQQQINNTYQVSSSGTVNLPHIGEVQAAGMSPMALSKSIESRFKSAQIYTSCAINVIANADARLKEKKVHVGGYVRRPGPVPYTEGMTVWQALQAAGGENEFGAINRMELFSASGKRRVLDLRDDATKNAMLRENDSLNVPQKNWLGQ